MRFLLLCEYVLCDAFGANRNLVDQYCLFAGLQFSLTQYLCEWLLLCLSMVVLRPPTRCCYRGIELKSYCSTVLV
jgi:hypothetical protein